MLPYLFLALIAYVAALPLPVPDADDDVVTEVVVAPTLTIVVNSVTGVTTAWLPPVELFISNGVSYTITLPGAGTQRAAQQANTQATDNGIATVAPTETKVVATLYTTVRTSATPPFMLPSATSTVSSNAKPTSSSSTGNTEISATVSSAVTSANSQPSTTSSTSAATLTTTPTTPTTTSATTSATIGSTTSSSTSQDNNSSTAATKKSSESSLSTVSPTTSQVIASSSTLPSSTSSTLSAATSGLLSPPQTIVYSPFANDRSCKDYDTIKADLTMILGKGISKVRLYGVDCLTITAILPICKELGITINQGFWITDAGVNSIDSNVSAIIAWAQQNGWGIFDYFTVGNEAVLSGYATPAELISKISSVKAILKNAGYSGLVTTAEPPAMYIEHPELCTQSEIDFVGINSHLYFNTNLSADQAGEYVATQQSQIAQLCSKAVAITETGYPHSGIVNGNNVPTRENQRIALKTILQATNGQVTILTTFDDYWKDPGPYGIEQSFGMIDLVW